MKLPYHITRAPLALRKARLDNIAIVPASLLFQTGKVREAANRLPTGSVLICTPHKNRQRKTLESVASYFQGHGHRVTTIPIEMMINKQAGVWYNHSIMNGYITSSPDIMGGVPVIKGTRIPVEVILYRLKEGYPLGVIHDMYDWVDMKTLEGAIDEAIHSVNTTFHAKVS
jgi:uncharacterized protein (DUF433 family)